MSQIVPAQETLARPVGEVDYKPGSLNSLSAVATAASCAVTARRPVSCRWTYWLGLTAADVLGSAP